MPFSYSSEKVLDSYLCMESEASPLHIWALNSSDADPSLDVIEQNRVGKFD